MNQYEHFKNLIYRIKYYTRSCMISIQKHVKNERATFLERGDGVGAILSEILSFCFINSSWDTGYLYSRRAPVGK